MRLEQSSGVRYQTKQDLVYQTLREAIMHCALAPGQRLVIEEIARELAVSPIPVREALQQLQSEGLVETVPHVGATVSAIAPNAVHEIFLLMEALELVGTRAAAEHGTPEAYARLRELVDQMDAAIDAGDHVRWGDLNTAFHRAIARVAEMPLLRDLTDRVFDRWDRVRRYTFRRVLPEPLRQSQREHRAMLAAMAAPDYELLEQLVKDHNRNALDSYHAEAARDE
jgi:DNA-binding GntR family transcriptional regulator